jgi:hypothetical protein
MAISQRIERVEYGVRFAALAVGTVVILAAVLLALLTGETVYGVLGVLIGAAIIAGAFLVLAALGEELPEEGHHLVTHRKSGERGLLDPGKKPRIPFSGHLFTIQKIDYRDHPEVIEGKLDYPGATYKAEFTWKPDRDHLDAYRASLDPTPLVRDLCAHAAERSAGHRLIAAVSRPGERPPLSPWGEEGLTRMAARRELWADGLTTTFEPPDLSKWGIEVVSLCKLTIIPPPPLEEWEDDEHIHVGNVDGEGEWLDADDRVAHVQIIGASRFGKSKLIEYVARQIIFHGEQGICLIDPNQQLYDDLVTWCAFRGIDVNLLDPSDERSQLGFNPFILDHPTPARIAARAKRLLDTTLKTLGAGGDAIQAQRILRCLYYVLIEQSLPITDLKAFMVPRLFDRRDAIMQACQNQDIRDQWEMLTAGKKDDGYIAMMQSSANRLFDLIAEPGVQRLLTAPRVIDLKGITETGDVLLVNLAKSATLSIPSRNLIGALLVDEIWDILSTRTRQEAQQLPGFNFAIDEFHNFATPQFADMLKEGAKYGLHLWLINHELESLEPTVRRALNACHTRIAFGGTSQKDAAAVLEGSRPGEGNDLREEAAAVPGLRKRLFVLRRTGKGNLFCTTPDVRDFPVKPERKERYIKNLTTFPDTEPQTAPAPTPPPLDLTAMLEQPEGEGRQPQEQQATQPADPKPEAVDPDDFYY